MGNQVFVPARDLTKMWRAIIEFNMIEEGDSILIGLSGGKDSMFLTAALAEIRKHSPRRFNLLCYTMDGMFAPAFPKKELETFCARYGLKHYSEQVNVGEVWGHRGQTPCFSCAYFRRAAMNRKARELGCNKIALAHHNDDAVETLMLNLFHSGQNRTFLPVTYLTRSGMTVIRPLLFYRESEIVALGKKIGLKPLKNPCPYDGHTQRQEMKELARRLEKEIPHFYDHMASALRHSDEEELWPAKLSQPEMLKRFRDFWNKKNIAKK
jgi:tRNA 2-thiocytidine biosynthesis protein TtcA